MIRKTSQQTDQQNEMVSNLGVCYIDTVWVQKSICRLEQSAKPWEQAKAGVLSVNREMVREGIMTEETYNRIRTLLEAVEAHVRLNIIQLDGILKDYEE